MNQKDVTQADLDWEELGRTMPWIFGGISKPKDQKEFEEFCDLYGENRRPRDVGI